MVKKIISHIDKKLFDKMNFENKKIFIGCCNVKISKGVYCENLNRLNAKFCVIHKYHRRSKCSMLNCHKFSRNGKNGFCTQHQKVSYIE